MCSLDWVSITQTLFGGGIAQGRSVLRAVVMHGYPDDTLCPPPRPGPCAPPRLRPTPWHGASAISGHTGHMIDCVRTRQTTRLALLTLTVQAQPPSPASRSASSRRRGVHSAPIPPAQTHLRLLFERKAPPTRRAPRGLRLPLHLERIPRLPSSSAAAISASGPSHSRCQSSAIHLAAPRLLPLVVVLLLLLVVRLSRKSAQLLHLGLDARAAAARRHLRLHSRHCKGTLSLLRKCRLLPDHIASCCSCVGTATRRAQRLVGINHALVRLLVRRRGSRCAAAYALSSVLQSCA